MKRLLAAAALLALALAGGASGGHARAAGTVSSSRLVQGGTIRITATVRTPAQPGKSLRGRFTVKNVSAEPQEIQLDSRRFWLVAHPARSKPYDTRAARCAPQMPCLGGPPPPPPVTLQPGATATRGLSYIRVLWSGPLRIVPGWDDSPLPALRIRVSSPVPPVDDYTAITDVVEKTGHLLDNCRPVSSGVAVTGWIDAPKPSAPPMRARCSVSLQHERGFDEAQVLILTPPGKHRAHLLRPYELLWGLKGRNAEAIGWQFVVTRGGAKSVDSVTVATTNAVHRRYREWGWTTSGPAGKGDRYPCGETEYAGGGSEGPDVQFVSSCRRR